MASRSPSHFSDFPHAFRKRLPRRGDDHDAQRLLSAYQSDRSPTNRDALVTHFLPFTLVVASYLHRRHRLRVVDPADAASESALMLVCAVERFDGVSASHLYAYLFLSFKHAYFNAARRAGHQPSAEQRTLAAFQRRFVKQNGRMPTQADRSTFLAAVINNPAIQIGDRPQVINASHSPDVELMMDSVASDDAPPWLALLSRDTLRLAKRGLGDDGRRVLEMILRGDGKDAVAASFSISPAAAARRMHGVLWELRSRADLAAELDAEPANPLKHAPAHVVVPKRKIRCLHCHVHFMPNRSDAEYCSDKCRLAACKRRLGIGAPTRKIRCAQCSAWFLPKLRNAEYCTKRCKNAAFRRRRLTA